MTKHLWAVPVFAQLVLASQGSFSVLDDLLAFPQYQVVFADTAISEDHAQSLHVSSKQPDATQTTVELSHQTRADDDSSSSGNAHPNPFARGDGSDVDDELAAVYERMTLHSQPFLCRIPIVDTTANNVTEEQPSKADEEKELTRATDRGWELLKGMQGNCIYFLSGWWSYSFCYNDGVKQFHQLPPSRGVPIYPPVEDDAVQSYILGTFPQDNEKVGGQKGAKSEEADESVDDEGAPTFGEKDREETGVARLETKGETRYLVQKLTGGTTCDLTGKERKIEVQVGLLQHACLAKNFANMIQFHCHPNTPDRIGMIKEVATCSYLMVIYTPRLCNDVAFLPPQENRAHAISCAPIIASSNTALPSVVPRHKSNPRGRVPTEHRADEPSLETDIELPEALAAAAAAAGHTQATSKPLPTIGGIVVGAKQLVGQPGSVIEKSVVVGGGKETLLGTVASSAGHGARERVMTAEQLRALEIKDPDDVESLRLKLAELAGRKPWRLELVDTPRGREFRGIIENDDGDDVDEEKGTRKADRKKGKGEAAKAEADGWDGGEGDEEWMEYEWGDWYGDEEGEGEGQGEGGAPQGSEEEYVYREEL
ncbi:Mannose-6-phosphate receptor binding protein [Neofusicoccum parvum]|uniref:Mannose-6-phosphate receptor binding protein n=1 Tax=Neofusicoccum parvum TaxID=310453 RepID=A0ACB5S2G5_9PEZI|nr:Mannose-6-phosphate receptor binding protein [Neofusicoccum parvum]